MCSPELHVIYLKFNLEINFISYSGPKSPSLTVI